MDTTNSSSQLSPVDKKLSLDDIDILISTLPKEDGWSSSKFPPLKGDDGAAYDPSLSLLSTHLSYKSLPKSILDCDCKIIYICRDPKDTFISLWHFKNKIRPNKDSTEPIPLEQAFDLYCRGVSPFGPHWDHILGYWKASLDHPDKVLFLKYEDMLNDPVLYLKRLAEFMGYPFSDEEVIDGVDVKIVQTCSFESLCNINMSTKTAAIASKQKGEPLNGPVFFRNGKVGDWKNYLTQEMADKIDQISVTKVRLAICKPSRFQHIVAPLVCSSGCFIGSTPLVAPPDW
ncbi:uncharacterized protein [Phyllobates terribilis]|uniref:uncharacterized protein n=1 Tax=Phyllobates terribilis TaxID=111132 RepID=UPI003CCB4FDC